jgi:hypothetical protein
LAGEKLDRKAYPVHVVADMRTARNENGDRLFARHEWLNALQIKGLFSRMTAKRRKQNDARSDDLSDVDVECREHTAEVEEILEKIAVNHPIMYDIYDLCEYYQQRKMSSF